MSNEAVRLIDSHVATGRHGKHVIRNSYLSGRPWESSKSEENIIMQGWVGSSGRTSLLVRQKTNKIIAIRHIFWAQNVFKYFAAWAVPRTLLRKVNTALFQILSLDLGDCFAAWKNDN